MTFIIIAIISDYIYLKKFNVVKSRSTSVIKTFSAKVDLYLSGCASYSSALNTPPALGTR